MKKTVTVISCIFIALIGFGLIENHTFWGILIIVFAILALIGGLATVKKDEKYESQESEENKKNTNQKKTFLIIAFVIVVLILVANICSDPDSKKQVKSTEPNVSTEEKAIEQAKSTKYQWQYTDDVDQMTSKRRYFAMIYSTTWLSFKFPYDGGSEAYLTVRNMDSDNEILLTVTKGQFISSYDYSKSLRIRFDNDQPIEIYYTFPSDGSSNIIFLDSADQLIQKIKNAHSFIVEVEFYKEGNKLLQFSYENFVWNH